MPQHVPPHAAIQALVRWDPIPFLLAEAARASEAGFPPGSPVYRIAGGAELTEGLRSAGLAALARSGTAAPARRRAKRRPATRGEELTAQLT